VRGFQGIEGMQGVQGLIGPESLFVARTVFVDGTFPSATPAPEDAANPYATVTAGIAAAVAARGADTTERWRVVVRPGVYTEPTAVIEMVANIDVHGSGDSTTINAIFASTTATQGPARLENLIMRYTGTASARVSSPLEMVGVKLFGSTAQMTYLVIGRHSYDQGFLLFAASKPQPTQGIYPGERYGQSLHGVN
jgi:hypothetical protein